MKQRPHDFVGKPVIIAAFFLLAKRYRSERVTAIGNGL